MRFYDLRHNCITKMLSDPNISERTVEEMAGHRLGSKVKEKYSHIRLEKRRRAVEALSNKTIATSLPTPATANASRSQISMSSWQVGSFARKAPTTASAASTTELILRRKSAG
jgi:hypothetical protein